MQWGGNFNERVLFWWPPLWQSCRIPPEDHSRVLAVAKVGSRVRPACLDLSEHVDGCAASMWASRHQAWPAASESPRLMKQL
jgi:hypothetical protein